MRVSLESIGRDTSYSHEPIIPPQYRQMQPTAHSHRRLQKKAPDMGRRPWYSLQPSNFSRLREYHSCFCAAIPCGWLDIKFWKSSNFRRAGLCLLALRPLRIFSLPKRDMYLGARFQGSPSYHHLRELRALPRLRNNVIVESISSERNIKPDSVPINLYASGPRSCQHPRQSSR